MERELSNIETYRYLNNIQNLVEMYNQYGENENRFIERKVIDLSKGYIDHLTSRYITKEYYEDLRQELTIALVLSVRKYSKDSKANFETYAYRAMNNSNIETYRYLNEHLKWEDYAVPTTSNIVTKNDKTVDLYGYKCEALIYRANLNSLTKREKTILEMRYQGYTYGEIANNLDCAIETVKKYLRRATTKVEGEMI